MRKFNGGRTSCTLDEEIYRAVPNLNSHGQNYASSRPRVPLLSVSYIKVTRTFTLSLSIFDRLSHYPWPIQAVTLLAPALTIHLRPYYGQRNRKSKPRWDACYLKLRL